MLDKVINFLRGDSDENEEIEGSYLSHLLDELKPKFEEELERCPEHDPLPLLVALVLKETAGDRFDHELDRPVTDAESPMLESGSPGEVSDTLDEEPSPPTPPEDSESLEEESTPPPAPEGEPPGNSSGTLAEESTPPPAPESAPPADQTDDDDATESDVDQETEESDETTSEEVDEVDGDESDDDADDISTDDDDETGTSDEKREEDDEKEDEATSKDEETASSADVDGEPDADDGDDESDETSDEVESASDADSETDASGETDEATDDPSEVPEEPSDLESATEQHQRKKVEAEELETEHGNTAIDAETNRAAETGMIDDAPEVDEDDFRVDSGITLEMGRVFVGMLIENDRLPVELQMGPDEIDESRRLLAGYFLGDDGLDLRAQEMLRLVEDKFDEGLFSQARILLQLFDADQSTRIENDRNLFYEEMILRFGIKRRHSVDTTLANELEERIDEFDGESDELEELCDWLAETMYVRFNFFGRDADEVDEWRSMADKSLRDGAAERLLDVVPGRRWRLPANFADPAVELLDEQFTREYVADYIIEHVKTCYFILRAVGETGLESYLDVFFDWVEEEFGVDGPAIMPWIYNQTTENERLIDDIFDELYRDYFEQEVESRRQEWDHDELEGAIDRMLAHLGETDLDDVPPGHYDYGRFVLDELFDVEYPTGDFPYKMHRIT